MRRIGVITRALPDSLDLMVVCLEAGLGLNATIARVGEERATLNDPLGDEFRQVSLEMRSGRSREEALRSTRPLEWAAGVIGTFLPFAFRPTDDVGPLVAVDFPIQITGLVLVILAITSLGRSIGIVPADRWA
jgi:Type II secretion system (T2SS), protein F